MDNIYSDKMNNLLKKYQDAGVDPVEALDEYEADHPELFKGVDHDQG